MGFTLRPRVMSLNNQKGSCKLCSSYSIIFAHNCRSKFNKRPPSFMKPGSYLPADLQNMFQLHYFKTQKELVPLGWSEVNEDKTYPTLASRNPQAFDDESSTDLDASTARTGSESSNDDDQSHNNAFLGSTRMTDESSEDELSRPVNNRVSLGPVSLQYF